MGTNTNNSAIQRTCVFCGKPEYPGPEYTNLSPKYYGTCHRVKPSGMLGWICPVCGRGVSPFSSVCPCNIKYEITFKEFYRKTVLKEEYQTSKSKGDETI